MATSFMLNPLDPAGSQVEQMAIDRQRALATALQQSGLTAPEGQMVSGRYVAPSAMQYLGKIAQGLSGKNMNQALDQRQVDYQRNAMQQMIGYLKGDQGGAQPAQSSVQAPSMPLGSGMSDVGAPVAPAGASAGGAPQAAQPASQSPIDRYTKARIIQSLYGDAAAQSFLKQFDPTDLVKTMTAAGIDPNSAQGQQILQQNIAKSNYIAPVNARPGSIMRDPMTNKPIAFNPHVPEGGTPVFDASGNVVAINPIQGVQGIIAANAAAKTAGEGSALPYAAFDAQGNPLPVTNRTAAATQTVPNAGFPGATQVPGSGQDNGSRLGILQQERAQIAAQPDTSQTKAGDLQAIDREIARVSGQPAKSPLFAAQPLGAVANANAQAKGQVDTMQNSYKGLQAVRAGGGMALEDIDKMIGLASQKNPAVAGGYLSSVAGVFSPNAAEYEKSRDNLVTNLGGQLGMTTDAAREMVYGSIPAYGAPKQAIAHGLETLKGQVQMRMLKADYLSGAYGTGDPKQYNALENQFDQKITPQLAGVITLPPGPQRAQALKAAAQNPQLRARLEWAAQNGILK
ncbi:MAG TPA: hypothetical protein VN081_06940 [Dongiaceae bacterium]|nr:hypothetical protein [Dongiaceae bacterium]